MVYTLPNWANSPSTATPLSAADLTMANTAINDLDSRVGTIEGQTLNTRVTNLETTAGADLLARKTSDTTRSNTATLADDPDLTVTVTANGVYKVDCCIFYSATTTGDIKFNWVAPSGNFNWCSFAQATTVSAAVNPVDMGVKTAGSTIAMGGLGAGTTQVVPVTGILVVGGTGGAFKLQWAQNTAEVSNCVVAATSFLWCLRIA